MDLEERYRLLKTAKRAEVVLVVASIVEAGSSVALGWNFGWVLGVVVFSFGAVTFALSFVFEILAQVLIHQAQPRVEGKGRVAGTSRIPNDLKNQEQDV